MKFKGPNNRTDRRFIKEPHADDYVELQGDISDASGGCGVAVLDAEKIEKIRAAWHAMADDTERRKAWISAMNSLQYAEQQQRERERTSPTPHHVGA